MLYRLIYGKSVTRLLSAATFARRLLALKLGELQTSFRPAGLGYTIRIELGSSPDPISKKVSHQQSALKRQCAQLSVHHNTDIQNTKIYEADVRKCEPGVEGDLPCYGGIRPNFEFIDYHLFGFDTS